jgi:DNA-binding transcriptional LysR family regulator
MINPRPSIKLRQLQYFLEVAKRLHFFQAAEALAISQPTLSHQIAELEGQIGLPLFNHAGRAIRLT